MTLRALALVAALIVAFSTSSAAAWDPLPPPELDDLVRLRPLTSNRTHVIEPGANIRFDAGRFEYVTIEFRPAVAEPYLRVWSVNDAEHFEAGLDLTPTRLGDGKWLIRTGMDPVTLQLAHDNEAPQRVKVAVARIESAEPWVYWGWLQSQLQDWVDAGAAGALPAGAGIPGEQGAFRGARTAALLMQMVDELSDETRHEAAVRHLAHAHILRAVQRHRPAQWRFYRTKNLAASLVDKPSLLTVDSGTFRSRSWRQAADVPARLRVSGPALVELGVRVEKSPTTQDARTDYELEVRSGEFAVHRAAFSSRAAVFRGDEPAEGDAVAVASDRQRYVEANGRVVGWRRRTRFWVPPGTHELDLWARGAPVYIDGRVHRPRTDLEGALVGSQRPARHLREAEVLLRDDESLVARLLRMEIADYRQQFDEVAQYHELVAATQPTGTTAAWLAWREASSLPVTPSRLRELARRKPMAIAETLGRELDWAVLARAVDKRELGSAAIVALRLIPGTETSSHRIALRSRAILYGPVTQAQRWAAFLALLRLQRARPHDEVLSDELERAWWGATYWDGVEPVEGRRFLQPLGSAAEALPITSLAERHGLLYDLGGQPYETWVPGAPDRAERLARLRVAVGGDAASEVHDIEVDGEPYRLVRREPLEMFDFAVEAGRAHVISSAAARVYATTPPEGAANFPAHRVLSVRRGYTLQENDVGSWALPAVGTERFVRLSIHVPREGGATAIEIDDGVGARRVVDIAPRPQPRPDERQWASVSFELSPGVKEISARPRGGTADVTLDVRAPRNLDYSDVFDVEVRLPADDGRIDRIREISVALRAQDDPELRLERVRLLMSLDQDDLALEQLEQLVQDADVAPELRVLAEGLLQSVRKRLSYRWLEIDTPWLGSRKSMPMDPGAAVLQGTECTEQQLIEAPQTCREISRYEDAMSASDPAVRVERARRFATRKQPHDWLFSSLFAAAAVELIGTDPRRAPAGLAAEAYGRMWEVMQTFPTRLNRSRMFAVMRWTSWETVATPSRGSFVARFEPRQPPVNSEQTTAPTMADPTADSVELAMTGIDGPVDDTYPLYGGSRRTLKYHVYWHGVLELQTACVDLRPSLQSETLPCNVDVEARRSNGRRDRGEVSGSMQHGQMSVRRWVVRAGENIELRVERQDNLVGRAFAARVVLNRSGRDSRVPARRQKRRLDLLPSRRRTTVRLQGPVVVRLDARGVIPGEATEITVQVDKEEPKTLSINNPKEPESLLMGQPLTRSSRMILWLDEPRTYRVRLRGGDGFAAYHLSVRSDDYDQLLSPDEDATQPETTQDSTQLFDTLIPLGYPGVIGTRSLVEPDPLKLAARAEFSYQNRDRGLVEEVDDQRQGYLSGLAGVATNYGPLWGEVWAGGRSNPGVMDFGADGYWLAPLALRLELRSAGHLQPTSSGMAASGRLDGSLLRSFSPVSDLVLLPRVRATGRWQPANRRDFATDLAPVVFNGYAEDHPFTFAEQLGVWYRPFVNALGRFELRLRHNTNGTLDQLAADLGARALLGTTRIRFDYTARLLLADRDRLDSSLGHDLELSTEFFAWVQREHLVSIGVWGRLGFVQDGVRPDFGLGLTYWFSGRGLTERRPSELIYDDLLEPRYFQE